MNGAIGTRRFPSTPSSSGPSLQATGTWPASHPVVLPHHRLIAYSVALELLSAVRAARVRDPKLRDESLRSAKSACLNTAEGAGRVSRPDKARSFAIARAEAGEAAAAVEIAASCGDATPAASTEVNRVADRLVALLTGLIR
jgi:four helix bundle protein